MYFEQIALSKQHHYQIKAGSYFRSSSSGEILLKVDTAILDLTKVVVFYFHHFSLDSNEVYVLSRAVQEWWEGNEG